MHVKVFCLGSVLKICDFAPMMRWSYATGRVSEAF